MSYIGPLQLVGQEGATSEIEEIWGTYAPPALCSWITTVSITGLSGQHFLLNSALYILILPSSGAHLVDQSPGKKAVGSTHSENLQKGN